MPLVEGQVIDGVWSLVRPLGAGTFGEVWLARHTELDHEMVLKIPTDPEFVRQLRNEGRLQFNLRHPNIVVTYDLKPRSDPPFVLMEFVDGKSLRQVLEERGKLPVEEALGLLRQILDALAYAHGQGVLHRDLKPENILLTSDGTVKVTDFGLGKVQEEVTRSLMRSGNLSTADGHPISGTIEYMSPEQKDGEDPNSRDDVYAVGILGFELLVGRRPSATGMARPLQKDGVSEEAIRFLEQACEERGARYADAGEMFAKLEAMRGSSGTERSIPKAVEIAADRGDGGEAGRELQAKVEELAELDLQIGVMQRRLSERGAPAERVLDQLCTLVEQKEKQAIELERFRARAEEEKRRQVADMQRMLEEGQQRREAEFLKDWDKYRKLLGSAHATQEIRASAWKAICQEWGEESWGDRPPGWLKWKDGRAHLLKVDPKGPFTNGLGMRFVPAGTPGVLFCIWETRVQDFRAFLNATGYGGFLPGSGGQLKKDFTKPAFFQGIDHPVVSVSWHDAKSFCAWLTESERREGRLDDGQEYRLPTDPEWSLAVGLANEGDGSPEDKSGRIRDLYPWGAEWPPPKGVGNYDPRLEVDDFDETSPVGSFAPNSHGLYDMGGNVWEWCEDFYNGTSGDRLVRGGSWFSHLPTVLASSFRNAGHSTFRTDFCGFRCVLAVDVPR